MRAALPVALYLDQSDAARGAAREAPRRAPQPLQGLAPEAHAGSEARAGATGLDLDHDQGLARGALVLGQQEIELAPVRVQATRQEAPAARAQRALDQTLARQGEERVPWLQPAQRDARRELCQQPREKPSPERPPAGASQALLGSASSAASFSCSTTVCTAEREKRRRTLSATCSTAISLVVVTTVP